MAVYVALRKESVDRNTFSITTPHHPQLVALRKESVDRNLLPKSVTARDTVALRKESVDRNKVRYPWTPLTSSRSPQGERG